jgi:hypothetical protein
VHRAWWPFPGDLLDFTGHEVRREVMRGGGSAKARINEISRQIAGGDRSGSYTIQRVSLRSSVSPSRYCVEQMFTGGLTCGLWESIPG